MEPLTSLALGLIAAAVAIPLGLAWLVMWRDTRRLLRDFDTRDRAFAQRQALHEMAWQIHDEIAERFHDSLTATEAPRRLSAGHRAASSNRGRAPMGGRAVQPSRRYGR